MYINIFVFRTSLRLLRLDIREFTNQKRNLSTKIDCKKSNESDTVKFTKFYMY